MNDKYEWRGATGPSLLALVGHSRARLDPEGVRGAFGEVEPLHATCIEGARKLTLGYEPRRSGERPLRALLEHACASLPSGRVALALSGGVDSAALAALLRGRAVAYTLAPSLEGYSEEVEACAIAKSLGIDVRLVRVRESDYVDALPEVIRGCESPLYNLHPVSRYLLARAVRADDFDVLVTGDGADEVFKQTSGADYLPVVDDLARAADLQPVAPFLDPGVAAFARPDAEKRELRELACALGVPSVLAWRPKHARFAPAMDLSRHWRAARIRALGQSLGRVPSRETDRDLVRWTTLSLFSQFVPGLAGSCAA